MASRLLPLPLRDPTVRKRRRHYRRRYVRPLIRTLLRGSSPQTREAAAYSLTWMDDHRAISPLLQAAANDHEGPAVRGQALEAIGSTCFGRRRAPLQRVVRLLHDLEPQVRFWACYALSQFQDRRAIPHLKELLSDDAICPGWWSVNREAAWAIAVLEGGPDADAIWDANARARTGEQRLSLRDADQSGEPPLG